MIVLHKFFNKLAAVLIATVLLLPIIFAPALAVPSEPFVLKDSSGTQTPYSKLQDVVLYINAHPGTYTLYLTKDYDMSQDGATEVLNGNIDLTVCSLGDRHILTKTSDYHFRLLENVKLTFKNIVLDGGGGNGGIYAQSPNNNSKSYIFLNDGFVLQNCHNYYASIYLVNANLTINGGKDNKGVQIINNGLAILSLSSNVTIKGGTFKYNGQVLCFQKENLEITGGLFENNGGSHNLNPAISVGFQGYFIGDNEKYNVSIKNATFIGNKTNDCGGAIAINLENKNNNTAEIVNCTFKENKSSLGGAIYVGLPDSFKQYGYAPINIVKCSFIKNYSEYGGGAIHDTKYFNFTDKGELDTYSASLKPGDFSNLNIDASTVFSGNESGKPYSQPPKNYKDFSNLKFKSNSFTGKFYPLMPIVRSLLNNYDVNYYYPGFAYVFDANGGKINTPTGSVKALEERLDPDAEYTIGKNPPVKEGSEFVAWEDEDGKLHHPLETLPHADRNRVFKAKWKEIINAPQTGDTSNIVLYVVLAAVAVGIFVFILSKNKRKK